MNARRCPSCGAALDHEGATCAACGRAASHLRARFGSPDATGDDGRSFDVVVESRGLGTRARRASRVGRSWRRRLAALAACALAVVAAVRVVSGGRSSGSTPTTIDATRPATTLSPSSIATTTSTGAPEQGGTTPVGTVAPASTATAEPASETTALASPVSDGAPSLPTEAPTTSTTAFFVRRAANDGAWAVTVTVERAAPVVARAAAPLGLTLAAVRYDELGRTIASFWDLESGERVEVEFAGGVGPPWTVFDGGIVFSTANARYFRGDPDHPPRPLVLFADGTIAEPGDVTIPTRSVNAFNGFDATRAPRRMWFAGRDEGTARLVDLVSGVTERLVQLPAGARPADQQGDELIVSDPGGARYVVRRDGSFAPLTGSRPAAPARVRRTETTCDDALNSCQVDLVTEGGRHLPLVTGPDALTALAVAAPAGPHRAAVGSRSTCGYASPCSPAWQPLAIVDADSGARTIVRSIPGTVSVGPYQLDSTSLGDIVSWSPDGRWLAGLNDLGHLAIVNADTAETFDVDDGSSSVNAAALIPTAPAAPDSPLALFRSGAPSIG